MDVSETWRIVGVGLAYVCAFVLSGSGFYFSFRLSRRWKGLLLFACSVVLVIGSGLALWFDAVFVETSRMRGPAIPSPDRSHVAVVYWVMSGAVGPDHVYVSIRNKYSPFATEVFKGTAQNPPHDPEVFWKDDHHLLISYWNRGKSQNASNAQRRSQELRFYVRNSFLNALLAVRLPRSRRFRQLSPITPHKWDEQVL